MPSSSRKINYGLRPAKHIERKMLIEIFRRLSEFGSVESYRYIGFGALYFSDFYQFHKYLGIQNMISIEKDKPWDVRYEYNKPFGCIKLLFGESNDILPELDWSLRTILWLDYDGKLDQSVLKDIRQFSRNATSGSIILVTINVESDRDNGFENFKQQVGEENIPIDITEKDMKPKSFPVVCHQIISNEIEDILNERNGGRHESSKFFYSQLINLTYSDGAKMLTVGGIIHEAGHQRQCDACGFEELEFVSTDTQSFRDDLNILCNHSYSIDVPNLTYREIRHLDAQLPVQDIKTIKADHLPPKEINQYARIYRYFPMFADSDV